MKNGYVREHRMIMSDYLGRKLLSTEHIHHKNGDKSDNRLENLELMTIREHTSHHFLGKRVPRKNSVPCSQCNALTASKYGLCRKHYKLEWQRRRTNIYENPELLSGTD